MSDPNARDERDLELLPRSSDPSTPDAATAFNAFPELHRLATSAVGRGRNHRNRTHRSVFKDVWVVQPTHVQVDPAYWRAARACCLIVHRPLGELLGFIVEDAIENGAPTTRDVERSSVRGASTGRHAQHFARIRLLDETRWPLFRGLAFDAAVTTARAVGLVVESFIDDLRSGERTLQ